ncbi:MAG: membrane protein insertase YidC [Acidobacteria bacterium]|nr:MAG: membrane protein insertase YidC [Acidobacteriota bacterium]
MERRLLLAIVLTFVVLTAYQWLVPTPQPAPAPAAPAATADANVSAAQQPAGDTAQAPAATTPAPVPAVETVQADTAERTVTVDNGAVRAVFSNRGATLTSWELANYQAPDGRPVDLVPHDVPPNQPKPFSLELEDAAKSARVNSALFTTTAGATADAKTAPVTLAFEYEDAAGLRVRKEFRLEPNSYVVTLTATVTDGGQPVNPYVQWGPGLGDVLATSGGGMFMPVRKSQAIFSTDGDVERILAADLVTTPRYQGNYEFAGVETHFFASLAVQPGSTEIEYYPLSIPSKSAEEALTRDYIGYDIRFQSMPNGPANVRFYVGPKHFETMRRVDADLVRAIWFGMFAFLCVPLLSALNWLHSFIGNYGWSIIALTVIINAAMFPLRHKSNVSMRKMQAIQPQVKAIQDRYSKLKVTDPGRQKMNTELMELYRQKGVNPASGCVPMLLTFPVLLAFYNLLSEAIELRGAPFILWIHDLAAPDPYYVTPILMGASQMLQQKMMPMTGADPVQQKMMLFMPVMFTFLFLTSPAGLALYWFASNVLIIGQQLLTNKLAGAPVKVKVESKK